MGSRYRQKYMNFKQYRQTRDDLGHAKIAQTIKNWYS